MEEDDEVMRATRTVKRRRDAGGGDEDLVDFRAAMRREMPECKDWSDEMLEVAIQLMVDRNRLEQRRGPTQ